MNIQVLTNVLRMKTERRVGERGGLYNGRVEFYTSVKGVINHRYRFGLYCQIRLRTTQC